MEQDPGSLKIPNTATLASGEYTSCTLFAHGLRAVDTTLAGAINAYTACTSGRHDGAAHILERPVSVAAAKRYGVI
jgi:hypothetical protein